MNKQDVTQGAIVLVIVAFLFLVWLSEPKYKLVYVDTRVYGSTTTVASFVNNCEHTLTVNRPVSISVVDALVHNPCIEGIEVGKPI